MRLLLSIALVGCVASTSVVCEDGRLCPQNTVCDDTHALCVGQDQLDTCSNAADGTACTAHTVPAGACNAGTCLPVGCGNGRLDPGEACDDGNTVDDDGCSADCKSTETCGNAIIDASRGEQCDDGNHLDHDGCSSTCQLEAPHWIKRVLTPQPARRSAMAAYDVKRDRVVLFGGAPGPGAPPTYGDTWEWDGALWTQITTPASPSNRQFAGMAYDGVHVVLFGGQDSPSGSDDGDTWLWDGVTWRAPQLTGQLPASRHQPVMVYDSKRARTVMFGGLGDDFLADTWEWDGAAWQRVLDGTTGSPPGRYGALAAYDPVHGNVVMTGGGDSTTPLLDTWTYDGTTWTDHTATAGTPPGLVDGAMAFDPSSGHVIAFGGIGQPDGLFIWDGSTWTTTTPASPPPSRDLNVLAQTATGLVTSGGTALGSSTALDDSWLLAHGVWMQPLAPSARYAIGGAADPLHGELLVFGGLSGAGAVGDTWALTTHGFVQTTSTAPTARSYASVAYDPVHGDSVLFGGFTSSANAETWIWSGTAWSQKTPATSPSPARCAAAVGYDGTGVLLFGGAPTVTSPASVYADTWRWDGSTWTQLQPATSPPARYDAIVGYDPIHAKLVMFGGRHTATTVLGDMWTFDGQTWTQVQPPVLPPARYGGALVWNPARGKLTLVGGFPLSTVDAWEWDGTYWTPIGTPSPPLGRNDFVAGPTFDGSGITLFGGFVSTATPSGSAQEVWELRWDGSRASERCDGNDLDGDGLVGCADPDCWPVCAPLCPPATSCGAGPTCGDGTCDPDHETDRTCPADCPITIVCGDGICDPGESDCPGDCP